MATIEATTPANLNTDLAREAHHRIANHLSLIVGMVQLQVSAIARGPETLPRSAVHNILEETAGKIISISHLHRKLADTPNGRDIDLARYLVESTDALISSLALRERVGIVYELGEQCFVPAESAQALGLIVSEIIMNAVKHAHPTAIPVQLHIGCGCNRDGLEFVEVYDDGVGLPENFNEKADGGVGFKLIRSLAGKLNAVLAVESSSLGLSFRLTFLS